MYINYLNPTHSDAASITNLNTTNHTLSGQANQILLCTTGPFFYFSFDNTSAFTAPCTDNMFCPGNYPLLLNVNHPPQINVLGEATGYLYITEFI